MTNAELVHIPYEQDAAQMARTITELAQPEGALYEVAAAKVPEMPTGANGRPVSLPHEVYDIVTPQRDAGTGPARWEMVADASAKAKEAAEEHKDEILRAAIAVGMINPVEDSSAINAPKAVVVVQDGANKTSIVRRDVAAKGIREAGINGTNPMYQFGSRDRAIVPTRADGSDNPEHKLLRGLAGDYLPTGEFTAFDANLATALAQGYEIETIIDTNPGRLTDTMPDSARLAVNPITTFTRALELVHEDDETYPDLTLIEPKKGTFAGGLDAVKSIEAAKGHDLEGRQFVIGTNGQYRPMIELQVTEWAEEQGVDMLHPVALGDEPGDEVRFGEQVFTTADRPPVLYANELSLFGRAITNYAIRHTSDTYYKPGSVTIEHSDGEVKVYEPTGEIWPRRIGNKEYESPYDLAGSEIE